MTTDQRNVTSMDDAQREALAFLDLAQASRATAEFPVAGMRVGDFRIEEAIGHGGMGVVYRAVQESLGRKVALKLVPYGSAECTPALAQRLEREGRLLASIHHDAILSVHAAGVIRGFHWVAMDLVEGFTLRDVLRGGGRGLPRPATPEWLPFVLRLLRSIAGALGAAHASGIVHRDVKPANVLVDGKGRPFLADFGLARESSPTDATLTVGFVGTVPYAAPEQARGEAVDPRSDVFSFGALAFEAVCGTAPFRGKTTRELVDAIQTAEPQWPRECRVPRDLRAVIDKCLEKRPVDRYGDAREVEAEFSRLLCFEPVLAVPRGPLGRLWRRAWRRPRRTLMIAAMTTLFALACVSAALFGESSASVLRLEAQSRLDDAARLFLQGSTEDYEAALHRLVAEADPPAGACGRLAERFLARGNATEAKRLYERELAHRDVSLADWLGNRIAERLRDGEPGSVDLANAPAAAAARDFAMLATLRERERNDAAAIEAVDNAVRLEPACVEWRLQRARILARLGRRNDVVDELQIVRHRRPSDLELVKSLARQLFFLGRIDETESLVRAVLATVPDEPSLSAELATCLCRRFRFEEAIAIARRAHDLAPDDMSVTATLAYALTGGRAHDEARAILEAAARAHPGNPYVRLRLAYVELATGNTAAAVEHAREFAAVPDPDGSWRPLSLELTGIVQLTEKRFDDAAATFEKLEALDPECPDWCLHHGKALEKAKRLEEADAAFSRALAKDALRPDILDAKARVLRARGQLWEALLTYERALGLDADWGQTYYRLADLWFDLGEPRVALRYVPRAVAAHPDWMDAWVLQALCQVATGAKSDAVESYRHALAATPKPEVRADLAELLDQIGRDREALDEYRKAREAEPALAVAWCGEGLIRLESEDLELRNPVEALRLLERAAQLEPDSEEYRGYVRQAHDANGRH